MFIFVYLYACVCFYRIDIVNINKSCAVDAANDYKWLKAVSNTWRLNLKISTLSENWNRFIESKAGIVGWLGAVHSFFLFVTS